MTVVAAGSVEMDGDELYIEKLKELAEAERYQYERCYREVKELRQLSDAKSELITELQREIAYLRNRLEAAA